MPSPAFQAARPCIYEVFRNCSLAVLVLLGPTRPPSEAKAFMKVLADRMPGEFHGLRDWYGLCSFATRLLLATDVEMGLSSEEVQQGALMGRVSCLSVLLGSTRASLLHLLHFQVARSCI